ncbi:hypothetical protein SBA2_710002 [Acidobacteriia bacterium SbA2]|nr:hypothetical protein SBA2_710002 [Acidobacteriia bacterium SbA2]
MEAHLGATKTPKFRYDIDFVLDNGHPGHVTP